jgi:hypothetical protein
MTINTTTKAFLIPAIAGFVVAVILGVLSRYANFDSVDWAFYIWPSAIVLGGIAGHATTTTEIIVIAVSAFLNAMVYGVVGWLCLGVVRLIRR